MSEGSVEIKELVKTYTDDRGRPTFTAVKNISLPIQDGEFMVLVGPSGCGKSTTLRMVAGLEKITSGTISIGGRVVNEARTQDRGIAMVFQTMRLSHMTIFNNMAFGLQLAKKKKDFISDTVGRTSKALGLDHMLERKPHALSGGQRQRVALGRAIVRSPKVFLFDEPLSNLDAKMRVQMRSGDLEASRATRFDHDLRHPRPGRSNDHGRPDLRDARWSDHASRRSADPLSTAGKSFRGGIYRESAHDLLKGRCRDARGGCSSWKPRRRTRSFSR